MPAIVGKDGMERKIPIALNYDELNKLQESAKTLKQVIQNNEL